MCAGNHERDWPNTGDRYLQENAKDSGGECGVVFEKRIPMPIPHPGQQWYSSSTFCVSSLLFGLLLHILFVLGSADLSS